MEYVAGSVSDGCFICEAAQGASPSADLVGDRGSRAIIMLNKFPYNSGHLLVAPVEHVAEPGILEAAVLDEVMQMVLAGIEVLRSEYSPEGFNVGANLGSVAGAGVPDHFHMHVVPRWAGDTNFMPVLSEAKVLPEKLEDTHQRLAAAFERKT